MWHSVLGRRYIYADASLQRTLSAFDSALALGAESVHNHDGQRMAETAKILEQAQLAAMESVQEFLSVAQLALATHVSAPPSWRNITRWRRRPSVTPMPSAIAETESGNHALAAPAPP